MLEWLEPRVVVEHTPGDSGDGGNGSDRGGDHGGGGGSGDGDGESVEPLDRVLSGIWNMWQGSRE